MLFDCTEIVYLYTRIPVRLRRVAVSIKRESGENPEQSRCCNSCESPVTRATDENLFL